MSSASCNTTCNVHDDEVGIIRDLASDVKWIRRIGSWWFTGVGALLLTLIPLIIALFIWLAGLDKRLSILEQQVQLMQVRK